MSFYVKGAFEPLHNKLTKLLPLLDKSSFASENETNCETALETLRNYETPVANSDELAIKNRFSAEINAKRAEITSRIKTLISMDIDAAANEDYGSGKLNSERKKIFTTYRNQIDTPALLAQIKALIKILVRGERIIAETNRLKKMTFANQLYDEYQNGQGDKKVAYNIVNQVDNQWVDRIIVDLGFFNKKDPQTILAERKVLLQTKYNNSVAARTVFSNYILDSVAALEEAEKLWIKVREAETKNDTDTSLLALLQDYQKAEAGTIKNKAYQGVNSYNQQVEAAIKHLQKADQSREELVKVLQEAENESELQIVYNQIKKDKLYKWSDKSKKTIDNLWQRKKVLFKIEKDNHISTEIKVLLQTALVKLIPDTVRDKNDEQKLTELENQLKTFQAAPEGEEKGKIYKEYKTSIDQVLTEISEEKQRYQQVKDDLGINKDGDTSQDQASLLGWAWGSIIVGSIIVVGVVILVVIQNFRKNSKSIKIN